jgi:hypothetical protein
MNKKNCYSFNPFTFEFTGQDIAYESPLEVNVFLLPANATFIEPNFNLLKDNQFFQWDNEEWIIKERIENIIQEEKEPELTIDEHWEILRRNRNNLLQKTDYYFLRDIILPENFETELKIYRQKLRDLPVNTIDPQNPIYPEKPDFIKT